MKKVYLITIMALSLLVVSQTVYGACTCDTGCDGTVISLPFSKDGSGEYCWQTTDNLSTVNSWNLNKLEINDENYTNVWSNSFPAKIDGKYYIYYNSSVSWGHFEATGSGGTTTTAGTTTTTAGTTTTAASTTTTAATTTTTAATTSTTSASTSTSTTSASTSTTTTAASTTTTAASTTTTAASTTTTAATTTTAGTTTTTATGGLDCSNALWWLATTHYETAGMQVYYNGNLYQNNWFSVNENPEQNSGANQVWTLIGACNPALVPPTPPTPPPPVTWQGTAGYASRYWDCCKPHCSWTANVPAGMTPLRTCTVDGHTLNPNDPGAVSSCEGGTSYVCYKFIPFVVANDLSYGFAATGSGDVCGKCFEMQFSGHGKYDDTPGAVAIQGKRMIVMAINIGYDVGGGQFDIQIPGGGVGMFNGCSTQWGIPNDQMGAVYGGLLSACNQEFGYYNHQAIKDCLRAKNDALFRAKGLTEMAQGLDWFIDWYEAADNPTLIYREVPCPQELVNISGLVRP